MLHMRAHTHTHTHTPTHARTHARTHLSLSLCPFHFLYFQFTFLSFCYFSFFFSLSALSLSLSLSLSSSFAIFVYLHLFLNTKSKNTKLTDNKKGPRTVERQTKSPNNKNSEIEEQDHLQTTHTHNQIQRRASPPMQPTTLHTATYKHTEVHQSISGMDSIPKTHSTDPDNKDPNPLQDS